MREPPSAADRIVSPDDDWTEVESEMTQRLGTLLANLILAAYVNGAYHVGRQAMAAGRTDRSDLSDLSDLALLRDFVSPTALDFLRKQELLTTADFETARAAARDRAFTLAGLESRELLQTVHAKIVKSVRDGEDFATWSARVDKAIERSGVDFTLEPFHAETVFRNATAQAYNAGQYEMLHHPDVADLFPYFRYHTVGDANVRESHAALEGVTLPRDDPRWNVIWPPNGHRCRCWVEPVSRREAESREFRIVEPPPGAENVDWPGAPTLRGPEPDDSRQRKQEKAIPEWQTRLIESRAGRPVLAAAPPPNWRACSTVEEAVEYAKKRGVKEVEFGGRVDIANHITVELQRLANMNERLKRLKAPLLPIPEDIRVSAEFMTEEEYRNLHDILIGRFENNILWFNPEADFWADASATARRQWRDGVWSAGDAWHPVRHDLGHWIHKQMSPEQYEINRDARTWLAGLDAARLVSVAATVRPGEFVAEVWSAMLAGQRFAGREGERILTVYRSLGGVILP